MARGTIVTRTMKDGKTKRYYAALWTEEPGGKRKQVWKTFEKKKQAEGYLDNESKKVREGDYFEPEKITFDDFADEWLEKYPKAAKKPIKPSTLTSYRSVIDHHLKPFFGPMLLGQIRSATIEKDFKSQLPERTPKTVRNILLVLQRMLNSAVEWEYLRISPFNQRVNVPALSKAKKGRALRPVEINKLLEKCVDDGHAIVSTAILTGMRRGEVFGLKWTDIDFETNQIHVRRELYWRYGKTKVDGEPSWTFLDLKSDASSRDIDLGPQLRKILLQHKLQAKENALGLVFANSDGGPVEPNNFVKRHLQPAVTAAEIGKVRFHDLRHTFGSLKLHQGEDVYYVQRQMGHSSIQVTVDIYGHLLRDRNPEAAARTEALIFGTQKAANR